MAAWASRVCMRRGSGLCLLYTLGTHMRRAGRTWHIGIPLQPQSHSLPLVAMYMQAVLVEYMAKSEPQYTSDLSIGFVCALIFIMTMEHVNSLRMHVALLHAVILAISVMVLHSP